jgi:licheninase
MLSAFLIAAAQVSLSANNYQIDEPMPSHSPVLAWSDEFNGTSLDRSRWRFDTSRNKVGWYNNERQYYAEGRRDNVRLENGVLTIEARKDGQSLRAYDDWGGQRYSSGKITTSGKFAFRYGFAEVRAKLPCGRGSWPAIWMLSEGNAPWPDGGEIDIMEHVGWRPHVVHGTVHTKLLNAMNQGRGAETQVPTSCDAFHRYQLDWTPQAITIGVDDHAYMRVRNDQPGGRGTWPFDRPFYLILNLAIGGDWGGTKGIDDAAFPQQLQVDYVRVWKPR